MSKNISAATEYECECIKCGHVMKSEQHCKDLKCSECGGQMRRKERPGPGQESQSEGAMTKQKWMSTGYLKSKPTGRVNREAGIIEGVKVCTEGEAQGHGVNLDADFVKTVVRFGNERKQGLKARFGHPNMCSTSLGTFLGRHKNFRTETTVRDDGSKALTAVADMFMSNEAKETPNGNLFDYVMGLAENEPDVFGTSIVFTPGREYRKTEGGKNAYIVYQTDDDGYSIYGSDGNRMLAYIDKDGDPIDPKQEPLSKEIYVECESLHACDCVDDPAANDGLFSKFSQETIAGQVTEFLDLNPQVWGAIQANPSIIEALSRYGKKMDEFTERYQAYRKQKEEGKQMSKQTNSEKIGAAKLAEDEDTPPEKKDVPAPAEPVAKPEDKPPAVAVEPTKPEAVKPEPEKPEPDKPEAPEKPQLSREEFARIADKFGDAIASKVMREGGDYSTAMALAFDATKTENETLRAKVAELNGQPTNGTPVAMTSAKGPATLFKTGK